MNFDMDPSTDEYFVTALQIFECCGVERSGTLRVDALMDKFAPFVKTNKAEFSFLKSLLDPDQENPEINVTKLAKSLHKYSERQKTKVDLDESFNLKSGQAPQDSDSGISSDGFQLLEELQCELKEKAHLAHQLRSQLDFTDRQHEEALATLTAERDSLRTHLNMLREENITLCHVRRDYDETCERLCGSEQALGDARRDLEAARKRARALHDQLAGCEADKLTLQELLTKSKEECHRINDMYAARQSVLLEENETLKTEHADLTSRLQYKEEFMQQMIKEKVSLEMELKDMLNKSNQTHLRFDRSIDVSYTEEQMLTALDSLNADSRFVQESHILDEESFVNALKEDQGRATNMSLFDEIRLSFCNMSRHNLTEFSATQCDKTSDTSIITIGTQTDEGFNDNLHYVNTDKGQFCQTSDISIVRIGLQTDEGLNEKQPYVNINNVEPTIYRSVGTQTENDFALYSDMNNERNSESSGINNKVQKHVTIETQTDEIKLNNNNNVRVMKCLDCDKMKRYTTKLERDVKRSHRTVAEVKLELNRYEDNLDNLQKIVDESNDKNRLLDVVVDGLKSKIEILELACKKQRDMLSMLSPDIRCAHSQTECDQTSVSTQVELPCADCDKRNAIVPHRSLKRFIWEPLKCLFQVFAVVCFLCAVSVLYGVSRRWQRCEREATPWRWLHAQDLMDLLLRIEYVADVPM